MRLDLNLQATHYLAAWALPDERTDHSVSSRGVIELGSALGLTPMVHAILSYTSSDRCCFGCRADRVAVVVFLVSASCFTGMWFSHSRDSASGTPW